MDAVVEVSRGHSLAETNNRVGLIFGLKVGGGGEGGGAPGTPLDPPLS